MPQARLLLYPPVARWLAGSTGAAVQPPAHIPLPGVEAASSAAAEASVKNALRAAQQLREEGKARPSARPMFLSFAVIWGPQRAPGLFYFAMFEM